MSSYELYQVKTGPEHRDYRFQDSAEIEARGLSVDRANYDLAWSGDLGSARPFGNPLLHLNRIYRKLNVDHPEGYEGRSASVSDVIVLEQGGRRRAWYVESIGYTEIPGF